jgi:hypothetical protein
MRLFAKHSEFKFRQAFPGITYQKLRKAEQAVLLYSNEHILLEKVF